MKKVKSEDVLSIPRTLEVNREKIDKSLFMLWKLERDSYELSLSSFHLFTTRYQSLIAYCQTNCRCSLGGETASN